MKRKTSAKKPRTHRPPTEAQLRALRVSTAARRQATIERLRSAIAALNAKKKEITVQTIYEECGLRYAAIHRNAKALALFRAHSTHLLAQKKRKSRKRTTSDEEMPAPPRDPLLNYKKSQLVERLRTTQQQVLELRQQLAVFVDAGMKREARIVELEARFAELEPYRAFVEQIRSQMQREERGRFGDLPPRM
jgi:hypothetical protein